MVAVGDQRRALDFAADSDAEHGHGLVAEKADHPRRGDPAEKRDRPRVEQPIDRLPSGDDRAEQDDADDDDPGQVLDPAVAVGKARARRRRASTNATQSGIAVPASPKLWIVSASSATLSESATITSCMRLVIARITNDHLIAQMPRAVVAIEGSITPWVWPWPCASR